MWLFCPQKNYPTEGLKIWNSRSADVTERIPTEIHHLCSWLKSFFVQPEMFHRSWELNKTKNKMSECCFFRHIMEITSSSQNKNFIFLLHFIWDKSYHLASFFFFSFLQCICALFKVLAELCLPITPAKFEFAMATVIWFLSLVVEQGRVGNGKLNLQSKRISTVP